MANDNLPNSGKTYSLLLTPWLTLLTARLDVPAHCWGPSGVARDVQYRVWKVAHMLACNRLRIDRDDGSAVADYRIEDDRVESRTLHTSTDGSSDTEKQWQRLTPEQLSSHIMRDTVVARWLRRRMGVHPLIRACS